jgi:hypothetical protein
MLLLTQWVGSAGLCGLVCFLAYRLGRKEQQLSLHQKTLGEFAKKQEKAREANIRPKRPTADLLKRMRKGDL